MKMIFPRDSRVVAKNEKWRMMAVKAGRRLGIFEVGW